MAIAVQRPDRFSRRQLFESGFGRALNSQLSLAGGRRAAPSFPPPSSRGKSDSHARGARLEPARMALRADFVAMSARHP